MLSFSSLDLKNYSPKTAYSPENESDPIHFLQNNLRLWFYIIVLQLVAI
jgi:hypothetical protein